MEEYNRYFENFFIYNNKFAIYLSTLIARHVLIHFDLRGTLSKTSTAVKVLDHV